MYSHADIETLTTDSQAGIYMDKQTQTDRQTETDTQTRRKTVRQTDRQTDR